MANEIALQFTSTGLDVIQKQALQAQKTLSSFEEVVNKTKTSLINTAKQSTTLTNAFNTITDIQDKVSSSFNKMSDTCKTIGKSIVDAGGQFKTFTKNLSDATKGITSFTTGLGTKVVSAAKSAVTSISSIGTGVGNVVKGITAALGPVALVITGINQGIELFKKGFESIKNVKGIQMSKDLESVVSSLKEGLAFAQKLVAAFIAPAISTFAKSMENVKSLFNDTSTIEKFAKAIGTIQSVISVVWDLFYGFYEDIRDAIIPVIDAAKERFNQLNERFGIINKTIGVVSNTFSYLVNNITNGLEVITKLLQGDFQGAWEATKKSVGEAITGVVDIFTTAEDKGKETLDKIEARQKEFSERSKAILQQATITTEEESDKTLAIKIKELEQYIAMEKSIVNQTISDEKTKNEMLRNLDKSYYDQKLNLEKQAYKAIIENNGVIEDTSIKSIDSLGKQITETTKKLQKFNETTKATAKEWAQVALSVSNSLMSLGSSITSLYETYSSKGEESLESYEANITAAQERLNAMLEEFDAKRAEANATKQEEEENEREIRIANLEAEMERSIEAGDQMSAKAIEIKLKQLRKEKDAEEKAAAEEEARKQAEADADAERERIKKQGEYEIALATYQKDLAEYNNNVAKAHQQKQIAIANAGIGIAQAIGAGALGIATSFGQGGLVMLPAAIAASVGVIAGAVSGLTGIKSASNALESAQSGAPVAPTPPQFAKGTAGYDLDNGYAVVGELGPELVRQKSDGNLEVIPNERAKNYEENTENNTNIINLYINEMVTEGILIDLLNRMKNRGFVYNV